MVDSSVIALIILALGLLVVIAGLLVYKFRVKGEEQRHPDYRVFFILGVTWIPLGIALDMPVFYILGIVYMVIGLANKDKWPK